MILYLAISSLYQTYNHTNLMEHDKTKKTAMAYWANNPIIKNSNSLDMIDEAITINSVSRIHTF